MYALGSAKHFQQASENALGSQYPTSVGLIGSASSAFNTPSGGVAAHLAALIVLRDMAWNGLREEFGHGMGSTHLGQVHREGGALFQDHVCVKTLQ